MEKFRDNIATQVKRVVRRTYNSSIFRYSIRPLPSLHFIHSKLSFFEQFIITQIIRNEIMILLGVVDISQDDSGIASN